MTSARRKKKTSSHLSTGEIDQFRKQLLANRARIVNDVSALSAEALADHNASDLSNWPLHLADNDEGDVERTLEVLQNEQGIVRQIDAALERIEQGTYGVCESTGKPIAKSRLRLLPWARYTTEAARQNRG